MKCITSIQISIPAKINLDQTETKFSIFSEPKEFYRAIYDYE